MNVDTVPWGQLRPTRVAAMLMGLLEYHVYVGRTSKRAIHRLLEHHGPYYDLEADGLRLRCRANDNGGEMIVINRRKLERRQELHQITATLRPGNTFVDIGANFGLFTLYGAKAVGPRGRVIAIEPNPEMLRRLTFNVAANSFANVAIAPVAVGSEAAHATLHVPQAQQDRASLHPVRGQDATCAVPVEPLLAILTAHGVGTVDLLKIDIEGYEDRALIPFFDTAARAMWPKRVLIERNEHLWQQDCIAHMITLGYRVLWEKHPTDAMLALE
jgi:FkbM family methyltransferase